MPYELATGHGCEMRNDFFRAAISGSPRTAFQWAQHDLEYADEMSFPLCGQETLRFKPLDSGARE
jgi:hypothetical protein